jgi:NAD(P)-dependent dehydrogenase (short-subunit alcohol dehydrogenase family)
MLDGKIAVVTGGGGGIGRATALEMAHQGAAAIAIADIADENGEETARLVRDAGAKAEYVRTDMRSADAITAFMATAADRFGGIDILLNIAGLQDTTLTKEASVDTLPEDVWDAVMDVNAKGTWLATKAAVPYLKESKAPAIVNTGSLAARVGYPMNAAYAASKGAAVAFTKVAALDLAKYGIRVNSFSPAAVDTPMMQKFYETAEDKKAVMTHLTGSHLIPRLAQPEEVAKLICFLASDDAGFITGADYLIDGGSLAWRGVRTE